MDPQNYAQSVLRLDFFVFDDWLFHLVYEYNRSPLSMSSTGAIKDPAQDAGSKPATTTGLAKPRIFAFIVGIDKVLDFKL